MDQFNYLAVLISIILGLGITQLLSGVGRLPLFVAWGIAVLTQREWYHRGVVAFTSLLMLAYIGALFGRLR